MADTTKVRQKIKQARAHIDAGELAKARAALKGVDHPKAQEMLADVEAQLAGQSGGFPLGPVLALVAVALLLLVGGYLLLAGSSTSEAAEALPTLAVIPTPNCTSETVREWWAAQTAALDTFTQDASSASRTMPGERLNERLAALRGFRADFPALPGCANAEMQAAVADLLAAMEDTIAALEGWSDGSLDGLAVTTALQEAESALRDARGRARQRVD